MILVSFNHLDTIRELVGDSESHVAMVDYTCKVLADVRSTLLLSDHYWTSLFFCSFMDGSLRPSLHS